LVNGKQHSIWFVPTGMNGLPQNVLLNFRLEFLKSDLTIYLPSGISEIFCQKVSTPGHKSGGKSGSVTTCNSEMFDYMSDSTLYVYPEALITSNNSQKSPSS